MEQLAIFGGKPVRKTPISYGHQYIDDADIEAVANVLRSDALTCGPKVTELEKRLCEVTGANYVVMVSNGTAALHLAAMAAGITKGDEVIVTPLTFAASANCILYCGGTPVFADVKRDTYNIDPEIGTQYKNKKVGSIADFTTFSFHPVKTVTAGEGGAIATNDEKMYHRLLRLRSHGITRNQDEMMHPTDAMWYNEQVELGYNYRMTDFQAALLLSQLDKLDRFIERRTQIVKRYDEAFAECPELVLQREIPESKTARHLYVIQLNPELLTCTRREFFDALYAENVHVQVHYLPVYWHSYYEKFGYPKGLCPNAEYLYEHVMSIPLFYSMTDEDVESVITAIKKVIAYYRR